MGDTIRVGRRDVRFSHPQKPLFADPPASKRELAHHYERVAGAMLPHLRDRPLALEAFPQGTGGQGFFLKAVPAHFPDWIARVEVAKRGGSLVQVLARDAATLVYLVGQNVVTLHVWLSRADRPHAPDRLIVDLDPAPGVAFAEVRAAARHAGDRLRDAGLVPFAMVTGSRGVHVVCPLRRGPGFGEVHAYARATAEAMVDADPGHLTLEWKRADRGVRIYVDVNRINYAQHAVAPYAVRARPGAPVAMPIEWDELSDRRLAPDGWTLRDAADRLAAQGDAWRSMGRRRAPCRPADRRPRSAGSSGSLPRRRRLPARLTNGWAPADTPGSQASGKALFRMNRLTVFSAVLASGAVLASPASAEIVKAPTGASSTLKLNAGANKALKKHRVTVSATGSAKKSGSSLSLPYTLSRWDFAAHEGDVAHFKKNTGLRFKRARGPSIAMVQPRVILDGNNGYITALISNVRVKTFTFKRSSGTISDTASMQRIAGLRLKLTKASALFLNEGLRRRVLRPFTQFGTLDLNLLKPAASAPGGTSGGTSGNPTPVSDAPGRGDNPGAVAAFGSGFLAALPAGGTLTSLAPSVAVDLDGDGQADAGVLALPLKSTTFDATTRTGTIALDGGLVVRANGQDVVVLDDPEIVIGATPATSGLYALVNGARIKVGEIDPNALNVSVLDGTVKLSDLDVRVSPLGLTLPGLAALAPNSQLASLDLSLPQV